MKLHCNLITNNSSNMWILEINANNGQFCFTILCQEYMMSTKFDMIDELII